MTQDGSLSIDEDRRRGSERIRRVGLSAIGQIFAKGAGFLSTLVVVPFAVRHFGTEGYGLWVAAMSLAALMIVADLGLGNALISVVAAVGRDDPSLRERASNAFFASLAASSFLLALSLLLTRTISWADVFGFEEAPEFETLVALTIGAYLISLPLGMAGRIQEAQQSGYVSAVWQGVGAIGGLIASITLMSAGASLPLAALGLALGPVVAGALNSAHLFFRSRPDLRPSVRLVSRPGVQLLARRGAAFSAIAIAGVVGYQTDTLIVARLLGPSDVAVLSVALKLFLIAPTLLSFFLTPLWPAYREALAAGDVVWVRATFRRSLSMGFLATAVPAVVLLFIAGPLVQAWVGRDIEIPSSLLVGLAMWTTMMGISGPVAMLLNGIDALNLQARLAVSMAAVNLCLGIVLTWKIGLAGPVFASVIAQGLVVLLPLYFRLRPYLERSSINDPPDDAFDRPAEVVPAIPGLHEGPVRGSGLL